MDDSRGTVGMGTLLDGLVEMGAAAVRVGRLVEEEAEPPGVVVTVEDGSPTGAVPRFANLAAHSSSAPRRYRSSASARPLTYSSIAVYPEAITVA
jgi:hypothetical protein